MEGHTSVLVKCAISTCREEREGLKLAFQIAQVPPKWSKNLMHLPFCAPGPHSCPRGLPWRLKAIWMDFKTPQGLISQLQPSTWPVSARGAAFSPPDSAPEPACVPAPFEMLWPTIFACGLLWARITFEFVKYPGGPQQASALGWVKRLLVKANDR